jgi:glycosyltransferase involved in cell wall biosynthesis
MDPRHPVHGPRVSIGLPVYNGGPFLGKALDSLLGQTFTAFELIISDNCSTDQTAAICDAYLRKDPRIRYIRQEANLGAIRNFWQVLEQATGEYFMWAAADDGWDRTFIEKCLQCLDRDAEVGLAFSEYVVISRIIPLLKMTRFPDFTFMQADDPVRRVLDFIETELVSHKANAIYGLWRRSVLRDAHSRLCRMEDEDVIAGFDIALLLLALSKVKFFQLREPLYVKTYRLLPAGHWLDVLAMSIRMRIDPRFRDHECARHRRHYSILQETLKNAGFDPGAFRSIIEKKLALIEALKVWRI